MKRRTTTLSWLPSHPLTLRYTLAMTPPHPSSSLGQVNDYSAIQEASTAKKAARKLLRQIEESEERAEIVEAKMAKALAITIPKYDLCAPWPLPEPDMPTLEQMEEM